MAANRANGFCCGGGGGMAFAEEPPDQRVNRERARQAVDTGADVVAVACPFCMTMLEDGAASVAGDHELVVRDVAELLRDSVNTRENTA
jgi:Fe-S oxidoreductase